MKIIKMEQAMRRTFTLELDEEALLYIRKVLGDTPGGDHDEYMMYSEIDDCLNWAGLTQGGSQE